MTASASDDVRVRGGATAEEIAAVLAVLRSGEDHPTPGSAGIDSYRRWRELRLAAVRRTTTHRLD